MDGEKFVIIIITIIIIIIITALTEISLFTNSNLSNTVRSKFHLRTYWHSPEGAIVYAYL